MLAILRGLLALIALISISAMPRPAQAGSPNYPSPPNSQTLKHYTPVTRTRKGRKSIRVCHDTNEHKSYGDSVFTKADEHLRLFFQNTKGLSYSTTGEDYKYYLSCMKDLGVDVAGLSETNTAWQHKFLQTEFRTQALRQHSLAKVNFGHPSVEVDPVHLTENRQYGGNLTMALGSWVKKWTATS